MCHHRSEFTLHETHFFCVSIDQSYFTVTVILGSGYIYSVNAVGTSHNMYVSKTASKLDIMMTLMRVHNRWSCVDMRDWLARHARRYVSKRM